MAVPIGWLRRIRKAVIVMVKIHPKIFPLLILIIFLVSLNESSTKWRSKA